MKNETQTNRATVAEPSWNTSSSGGSSLVLMFVDV